MHRQAGCITNKGDLMSYCRSMKTKIQCPKFNIQNAGNKRQVKESPRKKEKYKTSKPQGTGREHRSETEHREHNWPGSRESQQETKKQEITNQNPQTMTIIAFKSPLQRSN